MPKMYKKQALERLGALCIEGEPLTDVLTFQAGKYIKWKRDVQIAIRGIFGLTGSHLEEFNDAIRILRGQVWPEISSAQRALPILQSMRDEVGHWPDDTSNQVLKISNIPYPKSAGESTSSKIDPKKVFVVHGRNLLLRESMFNFLRSVGLQPIEWSQAIAITKKGTPDVPEILDAAFSQAQAVLVLLSGDDEAKLINKFIEPNDADYEKKLTPQARPNVLFEAGLAMGRYPERTILVQIGNLRPWSDVAGKHLTRMNNRPEKRQELVTKLKNAGCEIDTSGTSWYTSGDFDQK